MIYNFMMIKMINNSMNQNLIDNVKYVMTMLMINIFNKLMGYIMMYVKAVLKTLLHHKSIKIRFKSLNVHIVILSLKKRI